MSELLAILFDINPFTWTSGGEQASSSFLETFQSLIASLNIFLTLNHRNRIAIFLYNAKKKEFLFPRDDDDERLIQNCRFAELDKLVIERFKSVVDELKPEDFDENTKISPTLYRALCCTLIMNHG
eukprot:TRINITY_DN7555_c0_g1_i2.p1 TRINITY_DN7555_c0_g1~~TRINITY_DN7555_c0_g1_i2.p1  ORF type:complete len:126 (+),score=2.21 TRINITY_DN7555_c0_g1_i2:119-496(+)